MLRFVTAGTLMLLTSSALADQFSAIAYNPKTGVTTLSEHQLSAQVAQDEALSTCGYKCQIAIWTKNSFLAIAAGQKIGPVGLAWQFGWAVNDDRDKASEVALRECRLRAGDCQVKIVSGAPASTPAKTPTP